MQHKIPISGQALTIDEVVAVAENPRQHVALTADSVIAARRGNACLTALLVDQVIYGVNTGFGPLACVILGRDQLVELQYNLVRSHAAGMGEPLDERYALAAMLVRLNTLAKGYSGVSPELLRTLESFINHRIIPIIPAHGAVGASGDLVQLAHVAVALIGEGDVIFDGGREATAAVLQRLGLAPHRLQPKEGLALINGTSVMTGITALLCAEARRLIELAIRTGALCLDVVSAFADGICEELHALRPHPGQRYVAARLREHLRDSRRLRQRQHVLSEHGGATSLVRLDEPVQEVYSLRCIPQILGPIHDTLTAVSARVHIELNSVTDNPILLWDAGRTVHGGNFHGDYIALSADELKIAVVKLAMLSERRTNFLLNPNIKHPWAPFANRRTPGLNLALQGLQFVATSTTAQCQTLGYPQYLHSITTNGDNQDVVSLGTDAALIADRVVQNAFIVVAIEAAVLAQIVDCLNLEGQLSEASCALYAEVRQSIAVMDDDRVLSPELNELSRRLRLADFGQHSEVECAMDGSRP